MLKLYTDLGFLNDSYRRMVFPLLFDLIFIKDEKLQSIYKLVTVLQEADIVVCPINYSAFFKHNTALLSLVEGAKKYNKPLWIYTAGDYGLTVSIENVYTFRLGGFHSELGAKTLTIPSFINDPYTTFLKTTFKVLSKTEQPTVGFVGHAKSGSIKYIKEYINHFKYVVKRLTNTIKEDKQGFYPSSNKRAKYLAILENSNQLKTNFILRDQYRAGLHHELTQKESSEQFYANIYDNLYTFCLRGVGNFSVRFYETLAVGRIPILLNTDCRLPLSDEIDWENHIVIVELSEHKTVEEQILEFHESKSTNEIENIQKENRALWSNYLRRDSFFKHIHDKFIEMS